MRVRKLLKIDVDQVHPLYHAFPFLAQARVGVRVSIREDGTVHSAGNLSGGEESGLAYQTQQEHSERDTE